VTLVTGCTTAFLAGCTTTFLVGCTTAFLTGVDTGCTMLAGLDAGKAGSGR